MNPKETTETPRNQISENDFPQKSNPEKEKLPKPTIAKSGTRGG